MAAAAYCTCGTVSAVLSARNMGSQRTSRLPYCLSIELEVYAAWKGMRIRSVGPAKCAVPLLRTPNDRETDAWPFGARASLRKFRDTEAPSVRDQQLLARLTRLA